MRTAPGDISRSLGSGYCCGVGSSDIRDALAAAVEHLQNVVLLADDEQRFVYANATATRLLGYSQDDFVRMTVWDLTPAPDMDVAKRLWQQFVAEGSQRGRYRITRADGAVRVFQYSAVANVVPGVHLSDLYDITDLVHAEEVQRERVAERNLLVAEMHHRIRNMLATVLAVLRGEAASTPDASHVDLVARVTPRIQAMAEASRVVRDADERDAPVQLQALLEDVATTTVGAFALEPGAVRWSVHCGAREIPSESSGPLGLIVNEVLTNMLKHSARPAESLTIELRAEGTGRELRRLEVHFSRPFSTDPVVWNESFGLRLVSALAEEISAEVDWTQKQDSAAFTLALRSSVLAG